MRAYLSQQFGLELMVCPEMPSIGPISVPLGSKNEALSSSSLPTSDSEITLLVPNTSVGAIMGVGGQLLRVLEAEYSAHVSVNRAEERSTPGLRKVTIERGSKYAVSDQDAVENMKLCADRIRLLVEEHRSRVAEGR